MESVGQRMTRSRAKALGTPLVESLPLKTPDARTTGRRRKGVAQQPEEQERKQLQFSDEPAATGQQEVADVGPSTSTDSLNISNNEAGPGSNSAAHQEVQQEPHDNPSVLMASPIVQPSHMHTQAANFVDPVPLNLEPSTSHLAAEPTAPPQPEPEGNLPTTAHDSSMLSPCPAIVEASPPPAAASPAGFDLLPPAPSPPPAAAVDMMEMSPLPVAGSPLSFSGSPAGALPSPIPLPIAASPLPPAAAAAAPSPLPAAVAMEASPMAATTPLSFTSDAPAAAHNATQPPGASIPATPLSLMAEAMDAADFSPMPDDDGGNSDLNASPISLSGGAALTPMLTPAAQQHDNAMQLHQQQQLADEDAAMADVTPLPVNAPAGPVVSPLTFASDRHATPMADPSPVAGFVAAPDSVPHVAAAPVVAAPGPSAAVAAGAGSLASTFQGFAAIPPPAGSSEPQVESPSLGGLLTAASLASAPSPSPFSDLSDLQTLSLPQLTSDTPRSHPQTATPSSLAVDVATAPATATAATSLPTPLDALTQPRAPAPSPECGSMAGWTLSATPLANAIAASITIAVGTTDATPCSATEPTAAETETLVGAEAPSGVLPDVEAFAAATAGESGDAMDADDVMEEAGAEPHNPEEPAVAQAAVAAVAAATPVPAPARTPGAAQARAMPGRSPMVGGAARAGATPVGKTPAGAKPGAAAAATPNASKQHTSSYVFVESRYNKTPVNAGTANARSAAGAAAPSANAGMATPVAPTNAAAGAKSIKRVSIYTPEGPRSAAPQRQVVPTPYRPKGATQPPVQPAAPQQQLQQQQQATELAAVVEPASSRPVEAQPEASTAAAAGPSDERRAKAAERLKAIHATEQQTAAAPAAAPNYLAPTRAFAVKAVNSKIDAGSYDPRSLRQLKREVKEAAAKKQAKATAAGTAGTTIANQQLNEARESKLTPKVAERQLPMPDDEEVSEDEAQYDEGQENDLVAAMTTLEVAPNKGVPLPLRGLPAPQGKHIRFGDKGQATESPQRVVLRGLPVATGKYKRFD